MKKLAQEAKESGLATAFGEIGLDYDRLQLCPRDVQIKYFNLQLDLAVELQLPLFLHSRAAAEDFEGILGKRLEQLPKRGCVHSFTGTMEEMKRLVELGFDVGINGCSLKTDENVAVVKEVPLERMQIETDGPWVGKYTLASMSAVLTLSSARFDHLMRLPSTSKVLPNCPRMSRRRNGHLNSGSKAGMSRVQ